MSTDTPDAAPDAPTDTADTTADTSPATTGTAGTPTNANPATVDTTDAAVDDAAAADGAAAADDATAADAATTDMATEATETTDTRASEGSPDAADSTDGPADGAASAPAATSLTALLTPDARRGVFRPTGDATPAAIERIAAAAGWRTAVVDTIGVTDKRAVIAAIKRALGFDGDIGLNLDALADVLTDVDAEPGTLLVWSGARDFATADGRQHRQVLDVLRARAASDAQPSAFLTLLT